LNANPSAWFRGQAAAPHAVPHAAGGDGLKRKTSVKMKTSAHRRERACAEEMQIHYLFFPPAMAARCIFDLRIKLPFITAFFSDKTSGSIN
jgi:hypothetical protein